jgi:hypothetical protein
LRRLFSNNLLPLGLLLLLCAAVRVALLVWYPLQRFPDSGGYTEMAGWIRNLDFSDYLGKRAPGYPVFLLLGGSDFGVHLLQSLLGIAITLLLYSLTIRKTGSRAAGFLVAICYTIRPNLVQYESYLLSETLSIFLLVFSFWLYDRARSKVPRSGLTLGLLGLVTGLAALTRPMLALLAPAYLALLVVHRVRAKRAGDVNSGPRVTGSGIALFALIAFLLVFGWCFVNYTTLDYFGLTTFAGLNLTNHSGAFIEKAPERWGVIRDVYLKYREKEIARTGTHMMTIFHAADEMQKNTGYGFVQLSKQLTAMSLYLFVHYPQLYLESVAKSWLRFWIPGEPRHVGMLMRGEGQPYMWARVVEMPIFGPVNALFLLLVLAECISILRKRGRAVPGLDGAAVLIILSGSVAQALVEYGENFRYAVPFSPLMVYVVVCWLWARYGESKV